MKFFQFAAALLVGAVCAGCVQFEYEGASFAPVPEDTVAICAKNEIPKGWEVIGKAAVSGVDQQISRETLDARLRKEAAERGAELVAVTSVEVVPEGTAVDNSGIVDSGILADPGDATAQMRKDFEGSYGRASYSIWGEKVSPGEGGTVRSYLRIIRAEFLRRPAGK